MAKPIIAMCSAAFARLEGIAFTSKEKLALSLLFAALFAVTVNAAEHIAIIGFAITDITFSNSGGAIASCTVAPTLPAGLSIDSATCTISGTPTEIKALSVYTVTAKNAIDDTDSASFSLTFI
jgi:hypothetical protein